ncbi:MAG: hypothetical protein HQ481_20555 [Alphaproteobacteria bacterium]|nr:hypothetical protein [Alphaproteobacteria bacterium]
MSRLAAAREKLVKAVTRLEAAMDGLDSSEGGDPALLRRELAAVKRDHAKLAAVAEQVDARLDRTIGRLSMVLES